MAAILQTTASNAFSIVNLNGILLNEYVWNLNNLSLKFVPEAAVLCYAIEICDSTDLKGTLEKSRNFVNKEIKEHFKFVLVTTGTGL